MFLPVDRAYYETQSRHYTSEVPLYLAISTQENISTSDRTDK